MNILAAVALVAFLILIHEAGHLVVAKLCGVPVPVFSIGFGRRVWGVQLGGTDYRISAIPFGGYVRLAGADPFGIIEEDDDIDSDRAFLQRPVWQRIAIIAAGPVANLLLPIAVFSAVLVIGETQSDASVGTRVPALGLEAGDQVLSIDGQPTRTWREVVLATSPLAPGPHEFRVLRDGTEQALSVQAPAGGLDARSVGMTHHRAAAVAGVSDPGSPAGQAGLQTGTRLLAVDGVPVETWTEAEAALDRADLDVALTLSADAHPLLLQRTSLDEDWGLASAALFIGAVSETLPREGWGPEVPSPAAVAGLQPGDRLWRLDGTPVTDWQDLQQATVAERPLQVEVVRGGAVVSLAVTPALLVDTDARGLRRERAVLGVTSAGSEVEGPETRLRLPPGVAVVQGTRETLAIGGFILSQLGHLVTGEAALSKSVGGPVEMVRQASAAAAGPSHYARLLGVLSLSVGIVNLLPVPVLDGGQLLFFVAEAFRGRPVSVRLRERAQQIGVLALTLLSLVVLVMDIHRLLVG